MEKNINDQPVVTPTEASLLLTVDGSGNFGKTTVGALPVATTTVPGLMSAADKTKVNAALTSVPDGSVTAAKIATDTITAAQIAPGAVGTSELADGSVTAAKIATDTITAAQIAPGAVGTSELANLSVTNAIIANGSINSNKVATGAIGTLELADLGVTDAKLSTSGATAGTYGSATQSAVVTVNNKGRVTAISQTPISVGGGGLLEYDAVNTGSATTRTVRVTATGAGVTFAHDPTGATLTTITVPNGVALIGARVYDSAVGVANMAITFVFVGNTTTNLGIPTAMIPVIALTKSSGIQIGVSVTASANLINATFSAASGNLTLTITNGNTCWTAGSQLSLIFP